MRRSTGEGYKQALATADIAFDPALLRDGDWLRCAATRPRWSFSPA